MSKSFMNSFMLLPSRFSPLMISVKPELYQFITPFSSSITIGSGSLMSVLVMALSISKDRVSTYSVNCSFLLCTTSLLW